MFYFFCQLLLLEYRAGQTQRLHDYLGDSPPALLQWANVSHHLFLLQLLPLEYRAGKTQWLHDYFGNKLSKLPQWAKKAVANVAEPDFYPVSGWTHVSQLHGPKMCLINLCFFSTFASSQLLPTPVLVIRSVQQLHQIFARLCEVEGSQAVAEVACLIRKKQQHQDSAEGHGLLSKFHLAAGDNCTQDVAEGLWAVAEVALCAGRKLSSNLAESRCSCS